MAINYTPLTDFLTKDTLPKEDPDKVILGADFDAEFNAISTAFAGAAPTNNPTFTGTATFDGVTVNTVTINGLATLGSLDISGNATVGGTLDVASNTTVGGTLDVTGNATFGGDLDITGTVTSGGTQLPTLEDVQDIVSGAELGPISELGNLSNVDETGKADGDFLAWDNTAGNWEPYPLNLSNVSGVVKADSFHETQNAITSASNVLTVDCNAATVFTHTLTENTTVTPSNVPASGTAFAFVLKIVQDASASGFAVTWPTGTDWAAATAPTLTADASGVDVFVLMTHDGGTTWYGFTAGQAFA